MKVLVDPMMLITITKNYIVNGFNFCLTYVMFQYGVKLNDEFLGNSYLSIKEQEQWDMYDLGIFGTRQMVLKVELTLQMIILVIKFRFEVQQG